MLELISIVCSLVICIVTPMEVAKIRSGWINKRFGDDRERFLAAYRNQLRMLVYVGLGFGALTLVLGLFEAEPAEQIVKLFAGGVWFAVAAVCQVQRGRLPASA